MKIKALIINLEQLSDVKNNVEKNKYKGFLKSRACGKDGDYFGSLQWHSLAAAFALGNTSYISTYSSRISEVSGAVTRPPLAHQPSLCAWEPWPHWHSPCACPWVLCSTHKAGPNLCLLEALGLPGTYGNVSSYTGAGEKSACSQTMCPKARPGLPQHWAGSSDLAAVSSTVCSAAHGSPAHGARAQPSTGAQPGGSPAALQAGIPLLSRTSYLKMRQPPLQTRPQLRLNDWLFLN